MAVRGVMSTRVGQNVVGTVASLSLKWKRPKRIRWIVVGLCLSPFLNLLHYANQYQLGFGDVSVLVLNLPNLTVNVNLAPSKDGFETSFGKQDY